MIKVESFFPNNDKDASSISPGSAKVAADKQAKVAKENSPELHTGEDELLVVLPEPSDRDCSICRWGDWMPALQKHACWAHDKAEAEICRQNNYSSWEPKKNREVINNG